MAHLQGNQLGDDPSVFGLKFDSEKPRWSLLPSKELMSIVKKFNNSELDLTVKLNKENMINELFTSILFYKSRSLDARNRHEILSNAAFKMFLILRDRPYTKEELERSDCDLRWDLLNMKDVESVVGVYTKGARKYADNNWMKVSPDRYYDALIRHFNTLRTPERYDSELGCLHAHQVIWNLMALMWFERQIPEPIKRAAVEVQIPEPIKRVAEKLKGAPLLKIKPLETKVIKKKSSKKKK